MEPHQVYYLLVMGEIESVKIGKAWRLVPEAVNEYVERHPERKNREPSDYFIYTGNSGFLFYALPDNLPPDTLGKTSRVERRGGKLVYCAVRSDKVLFPKYKPVTQLELFTA
ncbi:MAG: hypothetical protein FWC19_06475 [Treponema sp.]|nr:hypothetical protein [Treponema sp.]MCL2272429.1 hypothetical protein [Treponema sp.]